MQIYKIKPDKNVKKNVKLSTDNFGPSIIPPVVIIFYDFFCILKTSTIITLSYIVTHSIMVALVVYYNIKYICLFCLSVLCFSKVKYWIAVQDHLQDIVWSHNMILWLMQTITCSDYVQIYTFNNVRIINLLLMSITMWNTHVL